MARNRVWRCHQLYKHWHRRLKNLSHQCWYRNDNENIDEMKNDQSFHKYKTVIKSCSYLICGGSYYKRLNYKFESDRLKRRIIQ